MAHIAQLEYRLATPAQQLAHDEELRLRGRMTNMKRTLMHSPSALRIYGEWFTLRDELRPVLGDRAIWIFCHAICVASNSPVGTGFMRRALIERGDNPDALELNETEALLVDVGTAIGSDPRSIGDHNWEALRALYPAKTLVDLMAFAGQMVATNVFTDAVQTTIDPELLTFLPT